MKTSRSRIAAVIAGRTIGSSNSSNDKDLAQELAAYLLSEHRTGELDSILRDIMQYRADHGIVEVSAVSRHTLAPAQLSEIENRVRQLYPAATKVLISPVHDDAALGGVRLEFANSQLDLSIRTKLNRFKQLTTAHNNGPRGA